MTVSGFFLSLYLRLKSLLLGYQTREEAMRRISGEFDSLPASSFDSPPASSNVSAAAPQHRSAVVATTAAATVAAPKKLLQLRSEEELKRAELRPFPFPDGK